MNRDKCSRLLINELKGWSREGFRLSQAFISDSENCFMSAALRNRHSKATQDLNDGKQTSKTFVVLMCVLTKQKGTDILRKSTTEIETKRIPVEFKFYEDREFCLSSCYCILNAKNGAWHIIGE